MTSHYDAALANLRSMEGEEAFVAIAKAGMATGQALIEIVDQIRGLREDLTTRAERSASDLRTHLPSIYTPLPDLIDHIEAQPGAGPDTAPRVGDTLTGDQLDALPHLAVVIYRDGLAWQKLSDGHWCSTRWNGGFRAKSLADYAPFTLAWLPPTEDAAA